MGRHKGSQNKIDYRIPPTGSLSHEDRLKMIASIIVDRILADITSANGVEVKTDA